SQAISEAMQLSMPTNPSSLFSSGKGALMPTVLAYVPNSTSLQKHSSNIAQLSGCTWVACCSVGLLVIALPPLAYYVRLRYSDGHQGCLNTTFYFPAYPTFFLPAYCARRAALAWIRLKLSAVLES